MSYHSSYEALDQLRHYAALCGNENFFGLPPWYKYVPIDCASRSLQLQPGQTEFDMLPLIGLALLEIGLRIAGLVAIFFVVYGGVTYIISQGEPDKVSQAKGTIINALVGLMIATFAIAIVAFVGNRIG